MNEAIIATISTVVGTILGWILANIRFGKISITLTDFKEEPLYATPTTMHVPGKQANELYHVALYCTIQIYNSSQINKAIRNCELSFTGANGKELFSLLGKDKETIHTHGAIYNYDDIEIVNIEPFASKNVKLVVYVRDIDAMYEAKSIYLKYKNERLKIKKIKYKDVDFKVIPRFYKEMPPHEQTKI